jgi:hypothetical protein
MENEFTTEEREEFKAWDKLSEKTWEMIDELESEEDKNDISHMVVGRT